MPQGDKKEEEEEDDDDDDESFSSIFILNYNYKSHYYNGNLQLAGLGYRIKVNNICS